MVHSKLNLPAIVRTLSPGSAIVLHFSLPAPLENLAAPANSPEVG